MIEWLIAHRETLRMIYSLVLVLICATIVLKADRLFRLSMHQGIRYFRNAFLFYGVGFFIRFLMGVDFLMHISDTSYFVFGGVFEFFLIMGGFFLLYSLIWKNIERGKEDYSSLVNGKVLVFYAMAIILSVAGFMWRSYFFMFGSQIVLFEIIFMISYRNYMTNGSRGKFLKYYFIAMGLGLGAWIINFIGAYYLGWNVLFLIIVYALNLILFFLFLIGVIKINR